VQSTIIDNKRLTIATKALETLNFLCENEIQFCKWTIYEGNVLNNYFSTFNQLKYSWSSTICGNTNTLSAIKINNVIITLKNYYVAGSIIFIEKLKYFADISQSTYYQY